VSVMTLWGRALGLPTVAALVVGLAMMPGSEAIAAQVPPTAAEFDADVALPVVESTAAGPVTPSVPEGDFSLDRVPIAVEMPSRSFMRPLRVDLEKVDLDDLEVVDRDRFSTTYDGPLGTSIVVLGEIPQNVEIDGEWVP